MRTVKITETFDGYPNGKRVTYEKGTEVEVADAFADLIIEKGHAKEASATPAAAQDEPASTKKGSK